MGCNTINLTEAALYRYKNRLNVLAYRIKLLRKYEHEDQYLFFKKICSFVKFNDLHINFIQEKWGQ